MNAMATPVKKKTRSPKELRAELDALGSTEEIVARINSWDKKEKSQVLECYSTDRLRRLLADRIHLMMNKSGRCDEKKKKLENKLRELPALELAVEITVDDKQGVSYYILPAFYDFVDKLNEIQSKK